MNISIHIKENINIYDLARKFRYNNYKVVHEIEGFRVILKDRKNWLYVHGMRIFSSNGGWEEIKIFSNKKCLYCKFKINVLVPVLYSLTVPTFMVSALVAIGSDNSSESIQTLLFAFLIIFLFLLLAQVFVGILYFLYLRAKINKFSKELS